MPLRPIALTSFDTNAIIATRPRRPTVNKPSRSTLAANAAIHVKASTADLFDYVNHTSFQNPKFTADIATGATITRLLSLHPLACATLGSSQRSR